MTHGTSDEKFRGWDVILGDKGGKCVKSQKSFFVTGGRWGPKFPIVVHVQTEEEADEVLSFEPAIRLILAEKDLEKQVRFALELPGSTTILNQYDGFYCVVHGRKCAIFTEYNEAIEAVNVVDRPIWRKVPSFGRAITYMLTKGESEKPQNKDWQDILNALSEVNVGSPSETPRRSRAQAESVRPQAVMSSPTPPAKLPAGSVRWSLAEQDCEFPTSAAPIPSPPAYRGPALFQDPTFNEYVFDFPRQVVDIGPGHIYQHVRTLRGIKATHTVPVADRTQTPSCGPALDIFLQALGYDVQSKLIVARATQRATSMGDFVREMCEEGLPALEAKYMWYLHSIEPAHSQWSETLIM
ncbi:hypothetical protein C8T65DRAFT_749275 [Cerioporus squamosus]|nr:hypothetical protein C8T65DRAFT_749275 [Cerioporus squamosus]